MKNFLITLIKIYQKCISPYKRSCCRFTPSCSSYAIEAIKKYGVFKGTAMAIWRILRCNPFNKNCGYDPLK